MTKAEQKILNRGLAAGTLLGLGIGAIIALLIAIRPELFTAIVR